MFFNGQLQEVVDTLKDDAPHLDSILMHMGSMYATLNKFEESYDMYQRAVYNVEKNFGKCTHSVCNVKSYFIIYYLPAIIGCWYVDQKTGAFA
jgi:hypothetical protein